VTFDYTRPPGERPTPTDRAGTKDPAHRAASAGRAPGAPPLPAGPETLFVTFDAPAVLGCTLSLG
jgi:hypothetical protein